MCDPRASCVEAEPNLLKKILVPVLKIVIPIAIIVWLCIAVQRKHPETFSTLWTSEKNWGFLALSVLLIFGANALSFVRWHLLLRAVDINIRLIDTLRLGFLGFLFGFVAPGQLGGDLFKAVFIAREQRERRTAAVATILIDRVCGLYGLLLVTTAGLMITGLANEDSRVGMIAKATYACTIIGGIGIVVVLTPGMTRGRLASMVTRIPKAGKLFRRVLNAIDLFQQRKRVLLLIGIFSVVVHLLIAIGLSFGARGIYDEVPSMAQHLVISPLAGVAGALPLSPGGLGSYEVAVTFLYDLLSPDSAQGHGVVVGLLYRFTTIAVAATGLVFYWTGRREVADVMNQVKAEAATS